MAGFNTAVTGLKAATTDLDVTGNNIANSSTVGFKASRTEFADIYATAVVGAGSSNTPGSGVTVSDIAQDFSAGTTEFTNSNLDLAISGAGFFQLNDGQGSVTYTRAGAFELDKDGYIVSKTGKYLQGYGLDAQGALLPIGNLAVTQKESPPKPTESIGLSFNVDSREDASTLLTPYDPNEPSSYTYSTTVGTFDSLGNEQTIKFNMVEQGEGTGTYDMYAYLNGDQPLDIGAGAGNPITIQFDPTNGLLSSVNGNAVPSGGNAPRISITGADLADPTTVIKLDLTNTTQFASDSIVKSQQQDGYTKGDLIGVAFNSDGKMVASFSNGQTQPLGVVAISTFENQSGLQPSGDTEWISTLDSGSAITNPPGAGLNGSLRSAALEQSNVDLSAELVKLIQAQRNFQANSKTLETLNNVTQTILQI